MAERARALAWVLRQHCCTGALDAIDVGTEEHDLRLLYSMQEHSCELLGLRLLMCWGVDAPRWTSIVSPTAESLPRME